MPKHVRRATVTRTVTFTATVDVAGRPEETDPNLLTLLGGAAGTTGLLSIGELLSGSIANAGIINRGNWSITGTSVNVEAYTTRPQNAALALGQRVVSVTPPTGFEGAVAKQFVVVQAGTTANVATEPNWALTDASTTTDGGVQYRTIPKFYTPSVYATGVQTLGAIVRPSANSLKEFLVTTAGTSTGAPTWPSNDTFTGTPFALPGAGQLLCLVNVRTYAVNTVFALGDIVKPTAGSSDEYIVVVGGTTDTTASLSTTVGSTVTIGTAQFKRIV